MRATVPAAYARALLRNFGKTPEQRTALLRAAGLDEHAFEGTGVETPVAALVALAGAITRAHGEAWPLESATIWSTALQGALDVAVRSAATLDVAMTTVAHYGHVRAPYLKVRLHSDRKARKLVFAPAFAAEESEWRAIALAVALSVHALFAQLMEEQIAEATIYFPWRAPAYEARMRALFACGLRFGAREFSFEAPANLRALASPFADPSLHAKAIVDLDDAVRRGAGEEALVGALERLISTHLPRRLGEEEAARRLGFSRRTLVRRLSVANLTFRSVLEAILRERARSMLMSETLSRDQMTAALGYADPTSFSRACRRWFGKASPVREPVATAP
jgi:AraC-like DNA-binding protein